MICNEVIETSIHRSHLVTLGSINRTDGSIILYYVSSENSDITKKEDASQEYYFEDIEDNNRALEKARAKYLKLQEQVGNCKDCILVDAP